MITAKGGSRATVRAVITRADGRVEDWGRIVHASRKDELVYMLTHPVVMLNRLAWRFRSWLRS